MNSFKKKCRNPACGCYFTPNKYKPDQEYCNNPDCKRCRDSLRQKKHYREHIRDPVWRSGLMDRKRNERNDRLNNPPPDIAGPDNSLPFSLSDLRLLLPGMIAFFTGARNFEEVSEVTKKCRSFGKNLQLNLSLNEKKLRFPHASFEAEMKCSSR